MLRRVSSLFQLIRTSSWKSNPTIDASGSSSQPSNPKSNHTQDGASIPAAPKSLADELNDAAKVLTAKHDALTERKEFAAQLQIVSASDADTSPLPILPYTLGEGYTISAEGHLRVYANAGLVVGDETTLHSILRQTPSVAGAITSLHIVLQGPAEIDLERRDSTMSTQRKGLKEWAHTVPALTNLTTVKVSHLRADEGGVYVPGEDEAEKLALEAERGFVDASLVIKALAWYCDKLKLIELEAVDVAEEAARAFEGSKVSSLRLEACPARVSTLIPRLSSLSEVIVVEKGDASVGCDYLGLLSHVKTTLTAVSLTLRDSKIDLQEFLSTFDGSSLSIIQCPFSTELSPEELEQKLKDAFPSSYGSPAIAAATVDMEVSVPTKKATDSDMEIESTSQSEVLDTEMGILPGTPTRKPATIKRSTIVEKRKEELKIAANASSVKDKPKLVGAVRKSRTTPQRQK